MYYVLHFKILKQHITDKKFLLCGQSAYISVTPSLIFGFSATGVAVAYLIRDEIFQS